MNSDVFNQVLEDQKAELARIHAKKVCSRMEEALFEWDSPLAQIVIGVRRSGKSTLCHKVLKDRKIKYAYINFDDERLYKLKSDSLNSLLAAAYRVYGDFSYLFLDEIQNIDSWFLFVNRLLRQGIHLFITGSNARLLSGELSSHLTGRYNQIELFPFSFAEYCFFKNVDTVDLSTRGLALQQRAFDEYLRTGGFPELFFIKNRRQYIQSLFDSIIKRDIQGRFKIKYVDAFYKMARYLADNFAQEMVYSKTAALFGFSSVHTAENYTGYLQSAYLLIALHKFSFKSKERVRNIKNYLVDTSFASEREDSFMGLNLGWRLENIVYIELLRRNLPLFRDVYYYRTHYEIDFVICHGNSVLELIQVCADISAVKTRNREVNALIKGSAELSCATLFLITSNESALIEKDGKTIQVVPIVRWLLDKK